MTENEATVIARANLTRQRCICQEEPNAVPCDCTPPVTRGQIGRLHAYLTLHPGRAVIYSELAGEWLAALHAFLPEHHDPAEAWLQEPFALPAEADVRHASDLDALLDELGAPAVAAMS